MRRCQTVAGVPKTCAALRRMQSEKYLPQLALYAYQLGASQAALAYLRHGVLVTFGPDTLQATLKQLTEATDRMKALDFHPEPSPERCHWCAFRGVCDAAWQAESLGDFAGGTGVPSCA